MKRLLIMLVLATAALVACSPSGSSASPAATTPVDAAPSLPAETTTPAP